MILQTVCTIVSISVPGISKMSKRKLHRILRLLCLLIKTTTAFNECERNPVWRKVAIEWRSHLFKVQELALRLG